MAVKWTPSGLRYGGAIDRLSNKPIDSASWTGAASQTDVAELARPPVRSAKLEPRPADPKRESHLAEYAELAALVGVMPPDLAIESFKQFLRDKDIPVFSLAEVVAYMDAKAAAESKDKAGWQWHPLRAEDNLSEVAFGRPAQHNWNRRNGGGGEPILEPASDHYRGNVTLKHHVGDGTFHESVSAPSAMPYDKMIPLHALRKVALIDREFTGEVSFFVCDYALAPAIQHPDPFLMAVIKNPNLENGTGRFIIDFWDEPGFGLEQMLKPATV